MDKIDSPEVFSLKTLNRKVLAGLDAKEAALVDREVEASKVLEECKKERSLIETQRKMIIEAEVLQIEALTFDSVSELGAGPSSAPQPTPSLITETSAVSDDDEKKRRVRIGDQRYAILKSLQEGWSKSIAEVANITGLNLKRIADQFRVDIPKGDVGEDQIHGQTLYRLTQSGHDLLNKFEQNRREAGLPLPPLRVELATIEEGIFE